MTDTAVRAVLDRLYTAWAANDPDAFVADYAEDATSILTGSCRVGRQMVRDRMAAAFAGPLRGSRVIDEVQSVRFLGDEVAVVVSRSAVVMAGEAEPPADRWVLATWTLHRDGGRWLVAAYHNCPT
jgi:uncharacterized protein (TIGR02246 family)